MKEFATYEDYDKTVFHLVEINEEQTEICVVKVHQGKIATTTYQLFKNKNGLYFEYGRCFTKIYVDEFEEVE
ncbi:MAG: hypothetical protein IJY70_01005 [Clostridia bacterium]|nr:hypothetical protein [Clostridia bacterium]